jgi:hypothetical protein
LPILSALAAWLSWGVNSQSLAEVASTADISIAPSQELYEAASNCATDPVKTPVRSVANTAIAEGAPLANAESETQPENTAKETVVESAEVRRGEQGVRVLPSQNEGATIERVFIYLSNPTNDVAQDEAYKQQIAQTFQLTAGSNFSSLFANLGLQQVQTLLFVKNSEYRLYRANRSGDVILAVLVTLQPQVTEQLPSFQPSGILVDGDFSQFPTLYQSDRALVTTILNGGVGFFSDTNSWFGSTEDFVRGSYQPKGTVSWPEFYIEPGIAGITQVGDMPIYAYGAASYLVSSSLRPDIFNANTRLYGDIEKLYGGLLFASKDSPVSFNLSVGRQTFQLNRNLLFGQVLGSANALERGASFLNSRTVYDNTILANLRIGDFLIQGFYLDPDELPASETNSRFLGVNLKYNDNRNIEASLAYITIPQSDSTYIFPNGQQQKREGLQVINPRISWTNPFGIEGLSLESEYVYEWHNRFAMSAQAGYIWLNYTFKQAPWRPTISYRFAGFSGDNPQTSSYERFDSLRGGGLDTWLQGISLAKVYGNSNLLSHRVELEVNPTDTLQFSLDYFYLYADQLNNLGGRPVLANLASHSIGQEVTLTTRWSVSKNLFLLGITSIAFPSDALRHSVQAVRDTNPWFTFQISLFLGF